MSRAGWVTPLLPSLQWAPATLLMWIKCISWCNSSKIANNNKFFLWQWSRAQGEGWGGQDRSCRMKVSAPARELHGALPSCPTGECAVLLGDCRLTLVGDPLGQC